MRWLLVVAVVISGCDVADFVLPPKRVEAAPAADKCTPEFRADMKLKGLPASRIEEGCRDINIGGDYCTPLHRALLKREKPGVMAMLCASPLMAKNDDRTAPEASGPPDPNPRGSFVIDRVWNDGPIPMAMVTYTNTSLTAFTSVVTIGCDGLDKKGAKLDYRERSFFAHEHGTITRGFKGTVKVPLSMNGEDVASASCSIVRAQ